jgi:hypothetical protein
MTVYVITWKDSNGHVLDVNYSQRYEMMRSVHSLLRIDCIITSVVVISK